MTLSILINILFFIVVLRWIIKLLEYFVIGSDKICQKIKE